MSSSEKVLARMKERVTQLSNDFTEYIDFFDRSENFIGPSIYFHNKTLAIRNRCRTVQAILQCDEFFDYLYATLTAWGMHRMGQGNTQLVDIEELKRSFRLQSVPIQRLENLVITKLDKNDVPKVTEELWSILSQLKVSVAEAQIVANSKALHHFNTFANFDLSHFGVQNMPRIRRVFKPVWILAKVLHLLPSLVPPIDRTYTYKFFYNRTMLTLEENEAFQEIYLRFHFIAVTNKDQIGSRVGKNWNTSETKTIDNAIVGFVLKKLRQNINDETSPVH